jgi:hypothetical protein
MVDGAMKTYRSVKATIATATIAAIKHMLELHDKAERKLIIATRKGRDTRKMWEEHDLLERALIRAAATLPQPVVERINRGEL